MYSEGGVVLLLGCFSIRTHIYTLSDVLRVAEKFSRYKRATGYRERLVLNHDNVFIFA